MERKEVMNLIQEINSASDEEREKLLAGFNDSERENILTLAQIHATQQNLFRVASDDAKEREKFRRN